MACCQRQVRMQNFRIRFAWGKNSSADFFYSCDDDEKKEVEKKHEIKDSDFMKFWPWFPHQFALNSKSFSHKWKRAFPTIAQLFCGRLIIWISTAFRLPHKKSVEWKTTLCFGSLSKFFDWPINLKWILFLFVHCLFSRWMLTHFTVDTHQNETWHMAFDYISATISPLFYYSCNGKCWPGIDLLRLNWIELILMSILSIEWKKNSNRVHCLLLVSATSAHASIVLSRS